jgi:hypothetical protein
MRELEGEAVNNKERKYTNETQEMLCQTLAGMNSHFYYTNISAGP